MGSEQLFWQRVAETQEWCAMHLPTDNLKSSLRSLELGTPSSTFSWAASWDIKRPASEWNKLRADEDSRRSWVNTLSDCRAKMLADAGRHPGTVTENILTQQFIVYLPGTNLADGAAAMVSDGYFDDDNIPPWDTWLMYFPAYSGEAKLISWVPPELTEFVDYAMRCNAEECLYWATAEQLFREKRRWNKLSNWLSARKGGLMDKLVDDLSRRLRPRNISNHDEHADNGQIK